jgi:Fe-S-cluster containining protein
MPLFSQIRKYLHNSKKKRRKFVSSSFSQGTYHCKVCGYSCNNLGAMTSVQAFLKIKKALWDGIEEAKVITMYKQRFNLVGEKNKYSGLLHHYNKINI